MPTTQMQVDHATPEDARSIAQIHVDAWRSAYATIFPADYLAKLSVDRREAEWRRTIAADKPELLTAKLDGAVQGWICFSASRDEGASSTDGEVWALYAAPDAWSTGVGKALWLSAKERLIDQGFTSCSLWVLPQNARAIRFYEAAGFALDASSEKTFDLAGEKHREVRYVCSLADPSFRTTTLTPMTLAEFEAFCDRSIPTFAGEKVQAGAWSAAEAPLLAHNLFTEMLPQGSATRGHFFFMIRDRAGREIGSLWFAAEKRGDASAGFVYDIEIRPEHRRKGHASRALRELDDKARELGLIGIGLHVFGHNEGAQALYRALGYATTDISMFKTLTSPAP
jgi:ribosomal protein S18 acetylase RimI-like enzyme